MIMTWVVTAALTLIAALSYGELAAAMPHAGGQYVYLREAFGPMWGFLYGWTLFLVIQTGTIAAVAVAFAKYTGVFFPWISAQNYLIGSGKLGLTTQQLLAILMIVFLTWSNTRGIRTGAMVQNVFTFAKIAALLGLVGIGFLVGRNPQAVASNFTGFWRNSGWNFETVRLVGVAMVGALFSADAWNNVTFTAGEVRNPRRNLPLSLALGVVIVSALYIAAQFVYLNVLTFPEIQHADQDRVATAAALKMLGPVAVQLMAAAIMISTFGCVNGLILSGARVYYAMAKDKLFFRRAGVLDPVHHAPVFSLGVQCIWAVAAHPQRQLQRPARLCYLCRTALLHPDDRRPVCAPPHTARHGPAVQGLRVSGAAGGLHGGGGADRSFAVDVQAGLHVAGTHHRAAGPARVFHLAKESDRMSLFATKSMDQLVNESKESGEHSLKRTLGPFQLTALGVGAIIGAGIFVLSGLGAHYAGPGLMLSFVLSGMGCAFAGLCYAEFAAMIPLAGSAYTYAYATLGELFAWIIGWDLTLEYAMGASTVSSGWSNHFIELLDIFHIKMPLWLAYDHWTALKTAENIVARQMAQAADSSLVPGTQAFLAEGERDHGRPVARRSSSAPRTC